jgi:hypothetical protein
MLPKEVWVPVLVVVQLRCLIAAVHLACAIQSGGCFAFVDTNELQVIERLPGLFGRYFHSPGMAFAH